AIATSTAGSVSSARGPKRPSAPWIGAECDSNRDGAPEAPAARSAGSRADAERSPFLDDSGVDRDRAQAEAMIADLAEPGLLHQPSQLEGCHEPLDRLRQIGVRPPVTSDERADQRNDAVEVSAE